MLNVLTPIIYIYLSLFSYDNVFLHTLTYLLSEQMYKGPSLYYVVGVVSENGNFFHFMYRKCPYVGGSKKAKTPLRM